MSIKVINDRGSSVRIAVCPSRKKKQHRSYQTRRRDTQNILKVGFSCNPWLGCHSPEPWILNAGQFTPLGVAYFTLCFSACRIMKVMLIGSSPH